MKDYLRKNNIADASQLIETLDKTRQNYYLDETDIMKDALTVKVNLVIFLK